MAATAGRKGFAAAQETRSGAGGSSIKRAGMSPAGAQPIRTVGHSTRTLEEFLALLRAHGVQQLVDIRTIPRSRHNPQFNRETLPEALRVAGIEYTHMEQLGGLRHARKDSPNTGWRNASFRGFADYMRTPPFEEGLRRLIQAADDARTVIMCAESVPWRCHRSLIADALLVRGLSVVHILSATRADRHALTPFAHVSGTGIVYVEAVDSGVTPCSGAPD